MALSDSILEKIKKDTENKKKGIKDDSSYSYEPAQQESTSDYSLSESTRSRIAMDLALKKLGFTHNRDTGLLHDSRYSNYYETASSVDDNYVSQFFSDWNNFANRAEIAYKGMDWNGVRSDSLNSFVNDTSKELSFRSAMVRSYVNANKDNMDEAAYTNFMSQLDSMDKFQTDFSSAYSSAKKYYSQWETEEDYNKYVAEKEEYEAKVNLDINAAEKEIKDLEAKREDYAHNHEFDWTSARERDAYDKYLEDMDAQISEKKVFLNQAKHIQEGITLSGVSGNEDFKENSDYVSTHDDGVWSRLTSQYGLGYDDLTYEYINNQNGIRDEIKQKHRTYSRTDSESSFEEKGYDYLKENEIAIYNYYYAKDGKEAAEKYLESIQATLNMRKATEMYGNMEDNTLLEVAFGVVAGLDQFESGTKNMVNMITGEDDYIPQSATQMAAGMAREDLADESIPMWYNIEEGKWEDKVLGRSASQIAYDAVSTTANMAPSIMTSWALSMVNPVAGSLWAKAGKVAGTAMMGASASGNAYQEALNAGYDKDQARAYAAMVGGSEAGLQYLLGGIGELGGTLSGNAIAKVMDGVDNAFLRTAIQLGGNMLSEGFEEGLQEILTPWFKNLAFHANEEIDWNEVAYSSLLGALTAGIMEGGSTISGEVNTYKTGKQLQEADISAVRLAEIGKTFSADTVAHQLAGRVDENTGAYTMGRLFNEIGATLTEQNVNDITNALVEKKMDQATARKNAQVLAYVVEGGQLSDSDVAKIEKNKPLAEAVRTTIIDSNSTWFQRTRGYQETLKAMATEMTAPKKAKAGAAEAGDENATAAGKMSAAKENGTESDSEAVDTSPAKVKSMTVKDGHATVKLEDGSEVSVKDADLDPDDGVRIETIASIDGISSEDANFILGALRTNTGASAQYDALGAKEAYKYGFYGFSQDHMTKHGVFANSLTATQRQTIYEAGKNARQKQIESAAPKTAGTGKQAGIYFDHGSGNVTAFQGADMKNLTDKQRAGVQAAMILKKLGIGGNIIFFESYRNAQNRLVYKDKNGNEVNAPNGWYSEKDGSIHIDLNAGSKGQGYVLFTLSHELTHFIEQWSPAKYKVLADFLVQNYEKGQSMDALVRAKQKKLSDLRGETISYKEAYSEVVADSMEAMLADGNVLEKLTELKAKDHDLVAKMKQFFDNLAAKIRSAYTGLTPDSAEGRAVMEMKDSIEQLQQLFADALVEASENFQTAMDTVVEPNAKTIAAAEIITDGAVVTDGEGKKYSIKSMKHDIAEGQMFEDLKKYCGWSQHRVNELRKNLNDLVEYMTPYRNILDMNETYDREGRRFSPYKPNSDPLYKISMDFSTLCSKRLLTQYVIENLQLRENRPMTAEEQMAIRDMLNEYRKVEKGLQVACAMCYVEAARLKSPKQITKWMSDPETQMRNYFADKNPDFAAYIKEKQSDFKESRGYARNATKKDMSAKDVRELNKIRPRLRSQYQVSADEAKTIARAKELPNSTYLTAANLANLSETDPTIYAAYTAFVRTATRSKSLETDEPYYYGDSRRDNGNGIVVTDDFIEAVNRENGMRFSSWSDWRIQHMLDYITAVIDNSVRGAAMHGYTKFGEEVRVLGKTGMMFNMSGVAGTQTGLNEDGSLSFSPTESIDANEAIQLRDEFPDTAGLQCIGVGDDHIVALLRSNIIDYVIPYHVSGLNAGLRAMANIHGWKDYTSTQHAAIDKSIKFDDAVDQEHWHEEPVYSEFFVGYNTGMTGIEAMRASADRYVQMCKDRGLKPKFEQFVKEDNYWKLLIDRKMINQKTGKLIQQKAVSPTFDFDTIKEVVDRHVQNYDSNLEARALNHIVENWDSIPKRIRDLKKQGGKNAKKASKAVDTLANQTLAAQPTGADTEQSTRDLEADVKLSDRDFTYKELTAKSNLQGRVIKANQTVKLTSDGSIDKAWVVKQVLSQCQSVQTKAPLPTYFVNVPDIGKNVEITGESVRHGFIKSKAKNGNPVPQRSMLNARASLDLPNILQNSIEVNRSDRGDNAEVEFSHILIGVTAMESPNGMVEYYVVRSVVESRKNQGAILTEANVIGKLHAINAKKIGKPHAQVGTRSTATLAHSSLFGYSVADLLNDVKDEFNDTFSNDVYKHFGMTREANDFSKHLKFSDRDNAPTFYSQMAKVVDGVKQEKLGAASVVNMLRGKGVKAEEIKWSGIEDWLAGKKSVTKAELQEFIAGSMLQIEDDVLTDKEIPYSQEQLDRIAKYEAERDTIAENLKSEWKRIVGTDIPITYFGAGLESAVVQNLLEANATKKGETEAGYKYKAARAALQRCIEYSDDYFGYDNERQAFREAVRDPNGFMDSYELTSFEKGVFRDFIKAKEAYSKVEGIPVQDQKVLKDIAASADRFSNRITKVKSEHYAEAAKHMTKYGRYTIRGGSNYRELLFRMPGATYSNSSMNIHWDRSGVLAHARIQDLNTFLGKMLFIEEIQSDWHNEGHKSGYRNGPDLATVENTSVKLIDDRYVLHYNGKPLDRSVAARIVSRKGLSEERIHEGLVNDFNRNAEYDARVPEAPFRDNYHEYVLKRLIRMAAEQGYDSIGWTTADIQSERWSNEFAEGYRIEYDQDIPKFLNKYGKKWGTKVGKTVLDNGTEVWSMAITDSMKDSVLTEGQPLYSDRDTESVSNRSLLANAFEGVAQNDIEKRKIQEYKDKVDLINAEERKLSELRAQIKELSFAKGPKDTKKIKSLQFDAQQAANRINTYDRQLLRLEASKPLQDVLDREKKMAYNKGQQKGKEALEAYRERATKTQRDLMDKWKESRKKGIENREKTAMKHKIQRVVGELNDLLLENSKKRHVPDSLKKAVADALSLVNMDTVGAEERAAKYAALIAKETDPDKIDAYTTTMENIIRKGEKMGQRLKELRDAYEEIQNSDDPDIANAYDPVIAGSLQELAGSIGNTSLRNMSIEQMSDVYDMYRMVLTKVRDANKSFLDEKKESISNLASRVVGEVRMTGGEHTYRASVLDPVRGFLWNNLKPVYAMEHIGSATLTKVFDSVRAGEDTWAKDVTEAREYYLEKSKKYGYDSWNFDKKYRFESTSGQTFELTLEQILSLYAYSKREQAHDHLRLGGFVFDSNIETYKDKGSKLLKYKVNTADAHQITAEILATITGKLTDQQKGFVDEMQEYLSTVMGAKGNEVTMKMYGVKLFKEKFYFPLKSAKQFMFEQNEVAGEVKIKNSGFTNKVVAKANNPVILSNFMDVWSGHVNDMSMYHAFVLPLEDFNRVFNYNSPKKEGQPPVSVKGTIQSAYSPAAVHYVKNLITDLNGGARGDSTAGIINKMMGLFKKGSVFASLSVVVQQPSAIARAAALVDTKYFIGPKVDSKRHKALWSEVKQYAPVAIIKEMGYFDTNMGKSTQDFIVGKEYSGIQEKMKALVTDSGYRDEVLSKAPALADEMAWCCIWEAVKREMHSKYPGLDVKSEPFLMLAGSRFTEVITKTQVYDSVLSRSANMRSKDTGMKMATAFMAEPTTSINMIADALLKGKRGDKRYCRTAIGAVVASQIFNSILVSFVYAGRDDDEDKTYLEKYIESLAGNVLDSLNPAGYIPFIKDIVSITKGYDVERSDMAVISDLWQAWENLRSDKVSTYRKVEGFAGSIAQVFGLPVKNIMRDVRGIWQTFKSFQNGQETTSAGIGYAVKAVLPEWIGGGEVSNQNQLYEAYLSGDKAQIARVEGRFKDQSAISSAIRKALRENDPRIHEAAIAWNANDLNAYMRIAKEIIAEKHFVQDDVVMAIRAEANSLAPEEETTSTSKAKGLFTADKFAEAIAKGDQATANAIRTDIIQTAQKNGKTKEAAEKNFSSSAVSDLKDLYTAGNLSEQRAYDALIDYCGMTEEDAEERIGQWEFERQYGFSYSNRGDAYKSGKISASALKSILMTTGGKTSEEADLQIEVYDWEKQGYDGATEAAVREYNENCASINVPKDVYLHIRKFSNDTDNDVDAEGKTIYYSAMKKVMAEINAQSRLTSAQKTAIARSLGWSEKNIQKYKTW